MILVWSMTRATVWEGCNYQNENFQMGSLIKGRGTVIFLRALSALIQAMYYSVTHKHYEVVLPWGGSRPRKWGVENLCIQLRNIGKSGPKGKFKIKKDKAGQMGKYKRENSESWLVLRKVLQQCTLKNHFKREREKDMLLINSLLVKKDRNKKTYQEMQCSVYRRMVWNIL